MAIKRSQFTLIEVIMALLIIVVAIVAITGVFPISMRMHNNAMRQNQATDIAEELLNLAAYKVRVNGVNFPLTETEARTLVEAADLDVDSPEWEPKPLANTSYYYYNDTGSLTSGNLFEEGIIRVIRTHTSYRGDKEIEVTELDVVVAIWESNNSPTPYYYNYDPVAGTIQFAKSPLSNANSKSSDDIDIVRLNMEVSWPGSAEYSKRKKISMVMEVRR